MADRTARERHGKWHHVAWPGPATASESPHSGPIRPDRGIRRFGVGGGALVAVAIFASQVGNVGIVAPVVPGLKAPMITSQPRSVTVAAGARARFVASAKGEPRPKVEWQLSTSRGRSWKRIVGATRIVYSVVSSPSRRGDEFRAVFSNAVGSARTHPARLTVRRITESRATTAAEALAIKSTMYRRATAPTITLQPGSASVAGGSTVTFLAAASGTPTPKVEWQTSTDSGRTWSNVTSGTTSSYSLVASIPDNGYEFQAVFTNSAGSATSAAATLTVSAPTTTTTDPPATTTTTTTTTTMAPVALATSGVITTNDSKTPCIYIDAVNGVLTTAELTAVENVTGVNYDCIEQSASADPTWSDWVNPWPTATVSDGWDAWLAADPSHQLVLAQQLIPDSECTSVCANPLVWESACAGGAFNSYATQLAENLVNEGAGNTVIRLGPEFNGPWENDYFGNTTAEYQAWAGCFAEEVTAIRAVPGAHFLFDWNPNTCTQDFPLAAAYPGNAYVDIIGADFYDADCTTDKTAAQEGWSNLFLIPSVQTSLSDIAAFAKAQDKPLSIPEWGEVTTTDDSAYMNGIIGVVENNDVAYQSYFDCNCAGITPLGSTIPASTAAYRQAFG